jgi:ubiquinone/menaquinone biosynthesis C-methylase UbiE
MAEDGERQNPEEVKAVYDEIAGHFATTREYPWPEVEAFLESVPAGECGLDVGCGNGRHTEPLARQVDRAIGLDVSREILGVASERLESSSSISLVQGAAGSLPIRTDTVDLGVYVATIHHLPGRARRRESLDELARVLRDGAPALVSAWSTAHDRFEADSDTQEGFDTTIDWTLPGGETVPRYYHIYAPAEFERDLRASGLTVDSVEISSGNCYARVRG